MGGFAGAEVVVKDVMVDGVKGCGIVEEDTPEGGGPGAGSGGVLG